MNYLKHYDLLVERGRNRKLKGCKERHHIIPRCVGGTDDKSNLVDLTAREHYFAHLLLAKEYGGSHWRAVKFMGELKGRKTSRMYEKARLEWVKSVSGENSYWFNNGERQRGELNHMWGKSTSAFQKEQARKAATGRIVTEETKRRMSEARKGKKATEETRAKMSRERKGRVLREETKLKIGLAGKGRKFTEEHKLRLSMSLSSEKRSEATRKAWETRRKNKSG